MLGSYAVLFMFWLTQAMSVSLSFTYAGYILSLIPAYIAFHFLRLGTRQKMQLIAELKSFDVELAECRSAYDRDFVFQGIATWYGSKDAFNDYVRGPLFEELIEPGADWNMFFSYFSIYWAFSSSQMTNSYFSEG